MTMRRPEPHEHIPYYSTYIDLVPDGDLLQILAEQIEQTAASLAALPPETAATPPAAGEWSPLDIAVHVADTERVFCYRLLRFSRGDATPLEGFEPDDLAATSGANERPVADVVAELRAVRAASITLVRGLRPEQWDATGTASDTVSSVRALAYMIAGHELHHLFDLQRAATIV